MASSPVGARADRGGGSLREHLRRIVGLATEGQVGGKSSHSTTARRQVRSRRLLGDAVTKFGAWFDWEVIPVMDLMDERTLNLFGESTAFHD